MKISTSLILVSLVCTVASSGAATLLAWDFGTSNGNDITRSATTVDALMSAATLSRGSDITPTNVTFNMGTGAFATDAGNNRADLASAMANGAFTTFNASPVAGNRMSLDSISVVTFTQNPSAIKFEVVFSQNNFATFTSAGIVSPVTANWTGGQNTFPLTGFAALQNTTLPTSFRIAMYGGGSFEQRGLGQTAGANNDITLLGTVSPVPEAGTVTLLAGLMAMGLLRRKRR